VKNDMNNLDGGPLFAMRKVYAFRSITGLVALTALVTGAPTVAAQGALEEVVVTARKRVESLQDVPIAITTIGEDQLRRLSAFSLKDIKHSIPSLHYQDRSALQTEITIRGVGGDARNIGIESGVGLYIDGVYAGRTSAYNIDVADIMQIEVLRGPQGTLFGKNTTGGALNVVTRKPDQDFRASGSLSYGNYDAVRFKGVVSGELHDNLFGKVVLASWNRDGYLDNIFDGSKLQSEDRTSGRLQLRYLPLEALEVSIAADFTKDDQDAILNQLGSPAAFGAPFFNPDRLKVNTDQRNSTKRDMVGTDLSINYTFGSGHQITSITAWRDVEVTVYSDIDQIPVDILRSGPFTDDAEQFTQELRITSPGGEFMDYIVGLYYYNQEAYASRRIFSRGTPLFFTDGPVDTSAWAIFANTNFNVTEAFTLSTGLRFTDEEKEGSYLQTSEVAPFFNKLIPDLETSSTEPSWTVAGNFKWNSDTSTYLSVSRGFKSGGFNVDPLATPAPLTAAELTFDPEFVTTYEAGFKADMLQNTLRLSGAVFFSDYQDRQVSQVDSVGGIPTVITRNAGESEIKGIELEFNMMPSDNWLMFGALSYLEGEYTEFRDATAAGADFSGNRTEKTPEWNVNFGVEYRTGFGNGEFSVSPQYSYVGKTYLQPDNGPFNVENGYSVLNLRIGYEMYEGRYGIFLWGKNLADEDYKEFSRQFQGSDQVLWGEPRTYGIEFSVRLD
jgi:iron complex outermembrane recepter protein